MGGDSPPPPWDSALRHEQVDAPVGVVVVAPLPGGARRAMGDGFGLIVDVGTLEGGYVRNIPLPRVPRVQSASHMTGTCYSQVPHVPTWSDRTRLLAGLGRSILPFSLVWLVKTH